MTRGSTKLRKLLKEKGIVRLLEAHNGLTGLIVENTTVVKNGLDVSFDGIWEGSLTDALSKGKPDISVVDMTSRMVRIQEILDVTSKPMVVDADNGGFAEIFGFTVRSLERIGVAAVVIEDKTDEKRNSLFGTDVSQKQDTIEHFCKKISHGKACQRTKDFMIITRIESLILKQGLEDALKRAQAYVAAGADGILIHSKETEPDEILAFCADYKKLLNDVPLIVVPTTYNSITETELTVAGVQVVVYANQLLRSAYPIMESVAKIILENGRSLETDEMCMSIPDVLSLIPHPVES